MLMYSAFKNIEYFGKKRDLFGIKVLTVVCYNEYSMYITVRSIIFFYSEYI